MEPYVAKVTAEATGTRECKPQTTTCSATVVINRPEPCCESPWLLRGTLGYISSQGSDGRGPIRTSDSQLGTFKLGFNDGLSGTVQLERLLGSNPLEKRAWGWSLGLTAASLDSVWVFDSSARWVMDKDRVQMLALTTGPSFRWGKKPWSFHLGPLVGLVHAEEASYADGSDQPGILHADYNDSLVFGLGAGIDVWFGECWGLTGDAQYLKARAEADDFGAEVDVEPLLVGIGVVYHF